MNRRDFLSRFMQTAAGAAIAHTLDLDKLLWVAGEKTIFLLTPSVDQWCAETFLPRGSLVSLTDGMRYRLLENDDILRVCGVTSRDVQRGEDARLAVVTHGPVLALLAVAPKGTVIYGETMATFPVNRQLR